MSLELNSCFLIDYRLWAAKSEGRHGSSSASSSASSIPLNLGVGCAPSCWPIFGFRTSWVLSRGAKGAVFCAGRVAVLERKSVVEGKRGDVGGRRIIKKKELKKFVRLASAFPSPPTRSLSNRKGRGRRSGT